MEHLVGYYIRTALTLVVVAAIYFIPSIMANQHNKENKNAIFIVNLFLGWTFIGWVIALCWANTKDKK